MLQYLLADTSVSWAEHRPVYKHLAKDRYRSRIVSQCFLQDSSFQIHILECWGPGLVYWQGSIPDQVKVATIMEKLVMMLRMLIYETYDDTVMVMLMVMMLVYLEDSGRACSVGDEYNVKWENPQWKPLDS